MFFDRNFVTAGHGSCTSWIDVQSVRTSAVRTSALAFCCLNSKSTCSVAVTSQRLARSRKGLSHDNRRRLTPPKPRPSPTQTNLAPTSGAFPNEIMTRAIATLAVVAASFAASPAAVHSAALLQPLSMSDVALAGEWKEAERRNQEVLLSLNHTQWACHFTSTANITSCTTSDGARWETWVKVSPGTCTPHPTRFGLLCVLCVRVYARCVCALGVVLVFVRVRFKRARSTSTWSRGTRGDRGGAR